MTKEEWKARAKAAEKRLAELLPVRSHEQYGPTKPPALTALASPMTARRQ